MQPPEERTSRGKFIVLLMLVLAVSLGAWAWWGQFSRSLQLHRAWGDLIQVLARAPRVTFLPLSRQAATSESAAPRFLADPAAQPRWENQGIDVSTASGLVHTRHALVQDSSYRWEPGTVGTATRHWDFALRFDEPLRRATLVFDLEHQLVILAETGRELPLQPGLVTALRKKQEDWSVGRIPERSDTDPASQK